MNLKLFDLKFKNDWSNLTHCGSPACRWLYRKGMIPHSYAVATLYRSLQIEPFDHNITVQLGAHCCGSTAACCRDRNHTLLLQLCTKKMNVGKTSEGKKTLFSDMSLKTCASDSRLIYFEIRLFFSHIFVHKLCCFIKNSYFDKCQYGRKSLAPVFFTSNHYKF